MSTTRPEVTTCWVAGGAGAPAQARGFLDDLQLDLAPAQMQDARLALSELVGNSVVHGGAGPNHSIGLQFTVTRAAVRCEVADQGPGLQVGSPSSVDEHFGLGIVGTVSARWGTHREGRSVWFEFDRMP